MAKWSNHLNTSQNLSQSLLPQNEGENQLMWVRVYHENEDDTLEMNGM